MRIIKKKIFFIFFIVVNICYSETFIPPIVEGCKSHGKAVAIIFPKCIDYFYYDEASKKLEKELRVYQKFSEAKFSNEEKKKLISTWLSVNFNFEVLLKKILGEFSYINSTEIEIKIMSSLLKEYLEELFFFNTISDKKIYFNIEKNYLIKNKNFFVDSIISFFHKPNEKIKISWILERRNSNYKIIDLIILQSTVSDILKRQLNIHEQIFDNKKFIKNIKQLKRNMTEASNVKKEKHLFLFNLQTINNN